MAMPANTIPMMWGMRSLLITIGAKRMMSSTTKNISVGSVIRGVAARKMLIFGAKVGIKTDMNEKSRQKVSLKGVLKYKNNGLRRNLNPLFNRKE
jgi:hypothetical protein